MTCKQNALKIVPALALIFFAQAAHADIIGRASVIDGDTLEIHGQRIRLWSIDAPESDQLCSIKGKAYRCGQKAAMSLDEIAGGKTVSCQERDRDKFNRVVAECFVDGNNINAAQVSRGWALSIRRYSTSFHDEMAAAKKSKTGIWGGTFTAPWKHRYQQP